MEPEGSSTRLREPATCPFSEPINPVYALHMHSGVKLHVRL